MIRYEIRVSDDADTDRDKIAAFIGKDDAVAAERWVAAINRKIDGLCDVPRMGQERPELLPGLRTVTIGRYVICYRVMDDERVVEIGRILHGARDFPAIFR